MKVSVAGRPHRCASTSAITACGSGGSTIRQGFSLRRIAVAKCDPFRRTSSNSMRDGFGRGVIGSPGTIRGPAGTPRQSTRVKMTVSSGPRCRAVREGASDLRRRGAGCGAHCNRRATQLQRERLEVRAQQAAECWRISSSLQCSFRVLDDGSHLARVTSGVLSDSSCGNLTPVSHLRTSTSGAGVLCSRSQIEMTSGSNRISPSGSRTHGISPRRAKRADRPRGNRRRLSSSVGFSSWSLTTKPYHAKTCADAACGGVGMSGEQIV